MAHSGRRTAPLTGKRDAADGPGTRAHARRSLLLLLLLLLGRRAGTTRTTGTTAAALLRLLLLFLRFPLLALAAVLFPSSDSGGAVCGGAGGGAGAGRRRFTAVRLRLRLRAARILRRLLLLR